MAPIIIAHRGASAYRPEHTLAAYELAIEMGAGYIELDLVSTADGVLVARHENEIGDTTDVASHPEFAGRRTTKAIDGASVTGWFTEDFSLADLKTLRAKERLPELRPASAAHDGLYEIPTLQEVIDLVRRSGRSAGFYPETKHPAYFESVGLPLEERLVAALSESSAPVYIQSFEAGSLRKLVGLTKLPLIQLIDIDSPPYDFAELRGYAAGIGVNKDLILPRNGDGRLMAPTELVDEAHATGLVVHAWTFRAENAFLPLDFRGGPNAAAQGDLDAEIRRFLGLGVDGIFTDNADIGVQALRGG